MADITIVNGVYKPTYNWGHHPVDSRNSSNSSTDPKSTATATLRKKLTSAIENLSKIYPNFIHIFIGKDRKS